MHYYYYHYNYYYYFFNMRYMYVRGCQSDSLFMNRRRTTRKQATCPT